MRARPRAPRRPDRIVFSIMVLLPVGGAACQRAQEVWPRKFPTAIEVSQPMQFHGCVEIPFGDNPEFDGISALHVFARVGQKPQALLLTDGNDRDDSGIGRILTVSLHIEADKLVGLTAAEPIALRQGQGRGQRKIKGAESIARLADGRIFIAFEDKKKPHFYWHDGRAGRLRRVRIAPGDELALMRHASFGNSGFEAMTTLHDGKILMIAQRDKNNQETSPAWVGELVATARMSILGPTMLRYPRARDERIDAYLGTKDNPWTLHPKGAGTLPASQDVLVISSVHKKREGHNEGRHFAAISRMRRAAIDKAVSRRADLPVPERFFLGPPRALGNFECLAAWRKDAQRAYVLIVSDNNGKAKQRTLFALFSVPDRRR